MSDLCSLLGIEYPIFQGAMAWISDARLAASVSEAGGLGIIAAGNAPPEWVMEQIDLVKELTDKPFAVNIMLLSPYAKDIAQIVIEKGVKIVVTGAGNPGKYIEAWKSNGIKVIPVVPSVTFAKRLEKLGADAIIAEGGESGGHIGILNTMALIPQVVDAVSVPVIAAGGIADARGTMAAFMLGADGVQLGTRFLASTDCNVHCNYKEKVLKAVDISTMVTGYSTGHPVRIIKNKFAREYKRLEDEGASIEELENFGVGALRAAAVLGDMDNGSIMAGQSAGLVVREESSKDIIMDIVNNCKKVMQQGEEKLKWVR